MSLSQINRFDQAINLCYNALSPDENQFIDAVEKVKDFMRCLPDPHLGNPDSRVGGYDGISSFQKLKHAYKRLSDEGKARTDGIKKLEEIARLAISYEAGKVQDATCPTSCDEFRFRNISSLRQELNVLDPETRKTWEEISQIPFFFSMRNLANTFMEMEEGRGPLRTFDAQYIRLFAAKAQLYHQKLTDTQKISPAVQRKFEEIAALYSIYKPLFAKRSCLGLFRGITRGFLSHLLSLRGKNEPFEKEERLMDCFRSFILKGGVSPQLPKANFCEEVRKEWLTQLLSQRGAIRKWRQLLGLSPLMVESIIQEKQLTHRIGIIDPERRAPVLQNWIEKGAFHGILQAIRMIPEESNRYELLNFLLSERYQVKEGEFLQISPEIWLQIEGFYIEKYQLTVVHERAIAARLASFLPLSKQLQHPFLCKALLAGQVEIDVPIEWERKLRQSDLFLFAYDLLRKPEGVTHETLTPHRELLRGLLFGKRYVSLLQQNELKLKEKGQLSLQSRYEQLLTWELQIRAFSIAQNIPSFEGERLLQMALELASFPGDLFSSSSAWKVLLQAALELAPFSWNPIASSRLEGDKILEIEVQNQIWNHFLHAFADQPYVWFALLPENPHPKLLLWMAIGFSFGVKTEWFSALQKHWELYQKDDETLIYYLHFILRCEKESRLPTTRYNFDKYRELWAGGDGNAREKELYLHQIRDSFDPKKVVSFWLEQLFYGDEDPAERVWCLMQLLKHHPEPNPAWENLSLLKLDQLLRSRN